MKIKKLKICSSGKSTLLKLLLNKIEPTSGWVKMHRNLRVSYFAQHHIEDFDLNLTPIETIQKRKPGMQAEGKFLFYFLLQGSGIKLNK